MNMLLSVAGVIIWVAGLWVVMIMFKRKGVLHGILGLLFIIYPFLWGLKNFGDKEVKKPMTLWLVGIAVSIVLAIVGGSSPAEEGSALLQLFM